MSLGIYDHAENRIREFAVALKNTEFDTRRTAFKIILHLVAEAAHAVEWVDSGEWSAGKEHQAIDTLFKALGADPQIVVKANAYDDLRKQLMQFFKEH